MRKRHRELQEKNNNNNRSEKKTAFFFFLNLYLFVILQVENISLGFLGKNFIFFRKYNFKILNKRNNFEIYERKKLLFAEENEKIFPKKGYMKLKHTHQ